MAPKNLTSRWYVLKIKGINKKSEKDVTWILKKTKQKINYGHVFIFFIFQIKRFWTINYRISIDTRNKKDELQKFNWENIRGIIEISTKYKRLSTKSESSRERYWVFYCIFEKWRAETFWRVFISLVLDIPLIMGLQSQSIQLIFITWTFRSLKPYINDSIFYEIIKREEKNDSFKILITTF